MAKKPAKKAVSKSKPKAAAKTKPAAKKAPKVSVKSAAKKAAAKSAGKAKKAAKAAPKKAVMKKAAKPAPKKTAATKAAVRKAAAPKSKSASKATSKTNTVKTAAAVAVGAVAVASAAMLARSGKSGPKASGKGASDLSKLVSPLDDRILVELVEVADRTPGGLFIPDSVDRNDRHKQGTVVAVGRGHTDRKGRLRPLDVQLGDTVLFDHYMGSELEIAGKNVIVIREGQLLGVVKP